MEMIHKIGRRKTAVARVYVTEGNGNITINKRDLSNYFPTATLQYKVKQPFTLTNNEENFDVRNSSSLNVNTVLTKQILKYGNALDAYREKIVRFGIIFNCSLKTLVIG